MAIEEWRTIQDWPAYEVSNLGRVRRNRRPRPLRFLRASYLSNGYPAFHLSCNGADATVAAHALVCAAFHGPRPSPTHQVAHWDGNPKNVQATNLRWATPKENGEDKVRHGRSMRGSKTPWHMLVESDIPLIRKRLAAGETCRSIADDYSVSREAINLIKMRRNWAWIP